MKTLRREQYRQIRVRWKDASSQELLRFLLKIVIVG